MPTQTDKDSQKDLLTRLADAGEDAINRLSDLPGGRRFADAANTMRERIDELQKKVRGIDELERRVERLEQQVAALTKTEKPRAARSTASSSASRAKPKPPPPPH
jgi:polyhydroxyalkanoate synthesis regulator phasin